MTRGLDTPSDIESLRPLLREAEPPRTYAKGSRVINQGEPALGVFLLTEGLVKIHRSCSDGRGAILGLRSAGWLLGAPSALLGKEHGATITAITPCVASRLPSHRFLQVLGNDVHVSAFVSRMLAQAVDGHVRRLESLSCHSARQRLEEFFDQLKSLGPVTERGIEVPLRDRELAQLIAVTPPYLSKLLRELIGSGVVRRERGVLLLRN